MADCRRARQRAIAFDCKYDAGHAGPCSPFTLHPGAGERIRQHPGYTMETRMGGGGEWTPTGQSSTRRRMADRGGARDPLGVYIIGFTLRRTHAEAQEVAEVQLALAQRVSDDDGVAHWRQVLGFLAATTRR